MRSPAFRAQAFRKNFQNVYSAGLDAGHATRRSSLVQPTGGRRSELPVALPRSTRRVRARSAEHAPTAAAVAGFFHGAEKPSAIDPC
jgi:hypothetical protein